jgi:hypothetical protein
MSSPWAITAMVRLSMYSRISSPTPLATTCGTAAVTSAGEANGASSVAWQGSRGYSRSVASVTRAKVPSEPTISWVRS